MRILNLVDTNKLLGMSIACDGRTMAFELHLIEEERTCVQNKLLVDRRSVRYRYQRLSADHSFALGCRCLGTTSLNTIDDSCISI